MRFIDVRVHIALAILLVSACAPAIPARATPAATTPTAESATPSATRAPEPATGPSPSAIAQSSAGVACPGLAPTQLAPGFQSRFPARTPAEAMTGALADPYLHVTFEDLAGIRPGPIRDPRVPLCRTDLLRVGEPTFVRQHPSTLGRWLLPIVYEGETLLTVFISVDGTGLGAVGGSRGGAIPLGTELAARRAGDTAGDSVVSAELVFAKPGGCGPRDTISWRLVRRSGTAVYLVPEFPGAQPPGALFREDEMEFIGAGSGRAPFSLAYVRAAC